MIWRKNCFLFFSFFFVCLLVFFSSVLLVFSLIHFSFFLSFLSIFFFVLQLNPSCVVFQYEYLLIFFFVLSCHLYLEYENIQGVKRIFDIYKIKLNNTLHMCKICKTYKVIKIPFVEHQEFERKNYIMD